MSEESTPGVAGSLLLDICGGYGCFRSLESHLGMRAVAEGLVSRSAAATKRNGRLSCEIPLGAIGIDQFDWALYAIGAIGAHGDFYFVFRHNLLLRKNLFSSVT